MILEDIELLFGSFELAHGGLGIADGALQNNCRLPARGLAVPNHSIVCGRGLLNSKVQPGTQTVQSFLSVFNPGKRVWWDKVFFFQHISNGQNQGSVRFVGTQQVSECSEVKE